METMVEPAEAEDVAEEPVTAAETAAETESAEPEAEPLGEEPAVGTESAEPTPPGLDWHGDLPVRMGRQIAKNARLERELQRANRLLREYRMADELRTLQQHDPTANLTAITELGEDYAKLRRAGVSAVAAYEAVKYRRAKGEIPPDTGALGSDRAQEKEFYTPEEVDRLSSRELDDPKIMERVMRSMTKWKK